MLGTLLMFAPHRLGSGFQYFCVMLVRAMRCVVFEYIEGEEYLNLLSER